MYTSATFTRHRANAVITDKDTANAYCVIIRNDHKLPAFLELDYQQYRVRVLRDDELFYLGSLEDLPTLTKHPLVSIA